MKAIIVLGAAVWKDGPSPTLMRRCDHAGKVWAQGNHDLVVVCGGLGHHAPTEACAMARLLVAADVPKDKVMLEDQSTTTLENLRFARTILKRYDCAEVTIVTDGYHGPRARMVARALGLQARVSAPRLAGSHLPTQAKQYSREVFALPAYALRLAALRWQGKI